MSFFKNSPGVIDLEPFNIYHLLAITVLIVLALLIYIYRNKLKNNAIDLKVRITASVIAFTLEAGYHISNLVYHTDFLLRLIPLDLCAITLWTSLILNIGKSKLVYNILYFWGIGGIAAFVYPDILGIGPDRWRYYHFFGVHAYIILTVVYFTIVYGYRISFKSFLQAVGFLLPLTLVVQFIDLQFYDKYKTDWMFLVTPPDIHTILDALPKGGWLYYFAFMLLGISVFLIAYLPWALFGKKNNR